MSDTMAQDRKSVLAHQDPDSWSRDLEEDVALLGGRLVWRTNKRNKKHWKMAVWMWTIVSTIAAVILVSLYARNRILANKKTSNQKRNLIFMVSDGMGPASLALTRGYKQNISASGHDDILFLDKHLVGSHRTRSYDTLISDSAAGATAFAAGFKTKNGAVSVGPTGQALGSVLEAAKAAGYLTGVVVTTSITDATPATFGSHVLSRKSRDIIANQMIGIPPLGRSLDLIIGGGRCHFLPNIAGNPYGSCRRDDVDLIKRATSPEHGWTYVDKRQKLHRPRPKLPLLALLALDRTPYEIDRKEGMFEEFPSLAEMTERALALLDRESAADPKSKGFFLVVEGSQIDNTSHDNDPAAHVREVLAYDKAFEAARRFLERKGIPGNLISTSDHETGGLSAGLQLDDRYPSPYAWAPHELDNVKHSAKSLGIKWLAHLDQEDAPSPEQNLIKATELLETIFSNPGPTAEEIETVLQFDPGRSRRKDAIRWPFSTVVSRRALVGYSTHGHSAVDVNVYAFTSNTHQTEDRADLILRGNQENTHIGKFLTDYLGVRKQQDEITQKLQGSGLDLGGKHNTTSTLEEDDKFDTGYDAGYDG